MISKYILTDWPDSQMFMEYTDLDYANPDRCIYGQDNLQIFVPEDLFNRVFKNEALFSKREKT